MIYLLIAPKWNLTPRFAPFAAQIPLLLLVWIVVWGAKAVVPVKGKSETAPESSLQLPGGSRGTMPRSPERVNGALLIGQGKPKGKTLLKM